MIDQRSYYVYVLLCADGTYYTGYSANPIARFAEHMKGQGARYTRTHKPMEIVHLERFRTQRAAMRRERAIKNLTHIQKRKLTDTTNQAPLLLENVIQLSSTGVS